MTKVIDMDIRDIIFSSVKNKTVTAAIYAEDSGIVSGMDNLYNKAEELGVRILFSLNEGDTAEKGSEIVRIECTPDQAAAAEDLLIGAISKPSGIATAARRFAEAAKAAGNAKIICGAWKKMPVEIKSLVRQAAVTGGVSQRMIDVPMVYLDKNYTRILGGIGESLDAVAEIRDRHKVIQIKGLFHDGDIGAEAAEAVTHGADVICVDSGNIGDLRVAAKVIRGISRDVMIAFGGSVRLEDLQEVIDAGAQAIDVGRSIIDAPLLDMKFEVLSAEFRHAGYQLLSKSELSISPIKLDGTNLTEFAAAVAEIIGVPASDVLVIDVREERVDLDVLRSQIDPHAYAGREKELIEKIAELNGVTVFPETRATSNGMLGWIASDSVMGNENDLLKSEDMVEEMRAMIRKRVIVFPSGKEVENKEIEDTNTPMLQDFLTSHGFKVARGEVLRDDTDMMAGKFRNAMDMGYGVIITTGGVGAEDKDHSVEATLQLDPDAATPYIVKFDHLGGRHHKPGIRIGVGQYDETIIINLPGPNDEVKACMETLSSRLMKGSGKHIIASELAEILRERLRRKMNIHHHG